MLFAARGDEDDEVRRTPAPRGTPAPSPTGTPEPGASAERAAPSRRGGELAVGITEFNANFVWPAGTKALPEVFHRWRDALHALRPRLYRLVVDWAAYHGRPLHAHQPGCMRDRRPCFGYAGVREQLEALGAAQRNQPGAWEGFVVFTGTPERYARAPGGCERPGTLPRSRPPTKPGIAAYGRFVERVRRLAASMGARVPYWSPWNEPNHPYFLSPQRTACSSRAPTAAVEPYVALAREMLSRLDPGQSLVLGELAGLVERRAHSTTVAEFVAGLPREIVCAGEVAGQHGYVGGPDPVDELAAALQRFDCPARHPVWITETGAELGRHGVAACRDLRRRLRRWHGDPRVEAAFQYTLREDDLYPTGLVSTDLARPFPALAEWTAWGGDRDPADAPPASACRA